TIFKHVQSEVPGGSDAADLFRFVIYRCIVGSTAYGLSQPGSDVDRRGFYLPPADLHWSLAGVPEQLETDLEEVYWELGKFVPLAVDEYRDRLLAIRRGELPWQEVEAWRLSLHQQLDRALASTKLPEHPDYEQANAWLIRARRAAAAPEYAR